MSATVPVRYDKASGNLIVGASRAEMILEVDDEGFSAHREDVQDISASGLRQALARARWAEGSDWEIGLYVSEVERSLYDPEYSPRVPVSLILDRENRLVVDTSVFMFDYPDVHDPAFRPSVERLLRPLFSRRGATFETIEPNPNYVVPPWLVEIRVRPVMRSRTVADLLDLGHAIEELVAAAEGDGLTRTTVRDLVRGGRADVLLGQPEGRWLDVKKQTYDLKRPAGKIALAQAVARFANGEVGGLIVVGMNTKKVPGGEIINSINPLVVDGVLLRQHAQTIDERLFPPPDLMTIEAVDVPGGGQLVLIDIPPQPEELKPFLVHGAVVDGKIEGAFISIVRRRGEDSIPITAPAIHSTLAAGRALLRRGQLPNGP